VFRRKNNQNVLTKLCTLEAALYELECLALNAHLSIALSSL